MVAVRQESKYLRLMTGCEYPRRYSENTPDVHSIVNC